MSDLVDFFAKAIMDALVVYMLTGWMERLLGGIVGSAYLFSPTTNMYIYFSLLKAHCDSTICGNINRVVLELSRKGSEYEMSEG